MFSRDKDVKYTDMHTQLININHILLYRIQIFTTNAF